MKWLRLKQPHELINYQFITLKQVCVSIYKHDSPFGIYFNEQKLALTLR